MLSLAGDKIFGMTDGRKNGEAARLPRCESLSSAPSSSNALRDTLLPRSYSCALRALLTSQRAADSKDSNRRAFVLHGLLCQWVDQRLPSFAPCRSLHGAFTDGLRLHALLGVLTGDRRQPPAVPQPRTPEDGTRNVQQVQSALEAYLQAPLDGFDAAAVANGNTDMLAALLCVLVIEFDTESDLAVLATGLSTNAQHSPPRTTTKTRRMCCACSQ